MVEGDMSAEPLAAVSRELVTLEECMRLQNEQRTTSFPPTCAVCPIPRVRIVPRGK